MKGPRCADQQAEALRASRAVRAHGVLGMGGTRTHGRPVAMEASSPQIIFHEHWVLNPEDTRQRWPRGQCNYFSDSEVMMPAGLRLLSENRVSLRPFLGRYGGIGL